MQLPCELNSQDLIASLRGINRVSSIVMISTVGSVIQFKHKPPQSNAAAANKAARRGGKTVFVWVIVQYDLRGHGSKSLMDYTILP